MTPYLASVSKLTLKIIIRFFVFIVLLGSGMSLNSCGLETENSSVSIEVSHVKLNNNRVRLLLSELTYIVKNRVGDPHKSERQFVSQSLFTSEDLAFDLILNGQLESIEFFHVATLGKRSYRNYFSGTDDNAILMARESINSADCGAIISNTSCRKLDIPEPLPLSTQGTYDFSGHYRFDIANGIVIYRKDGLGKLEEQPFASISYELNRSRAANMVVIEADYFLQD